MPRVRWSETLEQDESSGTSSVTKDTQPRRSSLKRHSHSMNKRKSVVRKEMQRQVSVDAAEAWRERGKLFREKLIMKDAENGGDAFTLSDDCEIEKYYDVADRVLEQFLCTTLDDKAKLTESYLVGNRLVKFVSRVLPTHKDYFSNHVELTELRCQSQSQLVQLLQYLEELALIIDEEEYQVFVRENQKLSALSGKENYQDSSDEVSSYEVNPYEEGLSFVATAPSNLNQEFEMPQESRFRIIQTQQSESWGRTFSHQVAPQIQESALSSPQYPPRQLAQNTNLETGWPASFLNDFHEDSAWAADLSRVNFEDAPEWPSRQQPQVSSWVDQNFAIERKDSFSSPEQATEKTVVPRALGKPPSFIERKHSPKSVLELPEWNFDDDDTAKAQFDYVDSSMAPGTILGSVEGYLQPFDASERPPPSEDGISEGEEEVASLTGSIIPVRRRRRHSLQHFKGCVRCLLE